MVMKMTFNLDDQHVIAWFFMVISLSRVVSGWRLIRISVLMALWQLLTPTRQPIEDLIMMGVLIVVIETIWSLLETGFKK